MNIAVTEARCVCAAYRMAGRCTCNSSGNKDKSAWRQPTEEWGREGRRTRDLCNNSDRNDMTSTSVEENLNRNARSIRAIEETVTGREEASAATSAVRTKFRSARRAPRGVACILYPASRHHDSHRKGPRAVPLPPRKRRSKRSWRRRKEGVTRMLRTFSLGSDPDFRGRTQLP